MVGYDPSVKGGRLSGAQHAVAGAVAGSVARLCCQPLDVLKIRLQLQYGRASDGKSMRYRGVLQSVARIVREEGAGALWKGHVPAQLLSIVYGTIQFSSYEIITESIHTHAFVVPSSQLSTLQHFIGGAAAGLTATTVAHPLDVVRTRLVAQREPKYYPSLRAALVQMARGEGLGGFYRGYTAALMLSVPYAALQFGAYSACSQLLNAAVSADICPDSGRTLLAGLAAGLVAKTCVHPLDVVKKRLQVRGFEHALALSPAQTRTHTSWYACLVSLARREGVRGLYRGLLPSSMKAASSSALNFCFYEMTVSVMRARNSRNTGEYDQASWR